MNKLIIKDSRENIKEKNFETLLFFEREINRFQNIIGYTKEQADNMKLDVAQMIKTGEVNEKTVANEKFIRSLLNEYTTEKEFIEPDFEISNKEICEIYFEFDNKVINGWNRNVVHL